jgi:hypothetical protein
LRQWAEDHLTNYVEECLRLDGRGEHCSYSTCRLCSKGRADYRCAHCVSGGELLCRACIVAAHSKLPFHVIEVCIPMAQCGRF